ncbi:Signal transduction histidine kinase [Maridesulfovibrio ferrireducens]|uniref:histidine kinase n=1 Tax=Maridesulfovibrio ferrireducens TaxID=246191 RepID=A0A1G9H991_9BACT|nr:ATP-binding protein [Maridesulfovibrio ferrireducens]SDL08993.1 Signal transduction histidine kinase [Maridesulfovibrio ferrireducens]
MRYLVTAFALFIMIFSATLSMAESEKRNVLFLNSYQNGYAWSDDILDGVREVLNDSNLNIDLHIEYMDTKRFKGEEFMEILHSYYAFKYKGYNLSAIIVSDNAALNFMLKYQDSFFSDVPVLFCGINDFKPDLIKGKNNYGGVLENPDIEANVNLALTFNHDIKKVTVVGDNSVTSRAIVHQIETAAPLFAGRLTFEYWNDLTLAELLKRSRGMDRNEILLFTPFYKGAHGELYTAEEVLQIISDNSPVMVFSVWEFLLGHGIVGGKLLSGQDQGRQAAKMAVEVLQTGQMPGQKVVLGTNEYYMFDYNILKKFNIDQTLLPEDSIIINGPDYFYKLNKQVFWTIIVSLFVLSIILIFLVISILQRRRVEKRIKAQLSFQEILMDTIPLQICWKDKSQRYLGANSSFTDFFEMGSPSAIIGLDDSVLKPDKEFAEEAAKWDKQVIETGKQRLRISWAMTREGGDAVWLDINKVPLYNEKGDVVGTLSTAQDVTRRVNLEKQLLQSQKMEAIGTLAGGIAHDFNNILTSIINSVELAMNDVKEGTITWKDLDRAVKAAQRGSRVVKQILTFSRPSQEGFKPTDISDVVRETVDFIKASLPRNIRVTANVSEDVPLIMADPTQIHQVIMNLCTNSFQSIRDSGGHIEVSLRTVDVDDEQGQFMRVKSGKYLKLAISDNGPGIPVEILDKIFDPFFTTKGKAEGTGLGLAVVHGLIKGHGGGTSVHSSPNVKTSFEIYLPVTSQIRNLDNKSYGPLHLGQESILFVEDDEDQLETTPRILESLGYTVKALSSPAEAFKLISADPHQFDLIITDYDMPEANGLDLAKDIQNVAPAIPVLIVSGRRNFLNFASEVKNVRKVLMKPYSKNIIADAIREVLLSTEKNDG